MFQELSLLLYCLLLIDLIVKVELLQSPDDGICWRLTENLLFLTCVMLELLPERQDGTHGNADETTEE